MVYVLYIYTMKILYLHSVCKINVVNFMLLTLPVCCKMQFPQYVVYTSHWGVIPLLPRPWVWYVSNPHHKANKIVAVHSVRFTSNTNHSARLRAGQAWSAPRSGQRAPVEMGHHVWAGAHGLQGASVHELESPKVVSLSWVLSSTSNWSSNWNQHQSKQSH